MPNLQHEVKSFFQRAVQQCLWNVFTEHIVMFMTAKKYQEVSQMSILLSFVAHDASACHHSTKTLRHDSQMRAISFKLFLHQLSLSCVQVSCTFCNLSFLLTPAIQIQIGSCNSSWDKTKGNITIWQSKCPFGTFSVVFGVHF